MAHKDFPSIIYTILPGRGWTVLSGTFADREALEWGKSEVQLWMGEAQGDSKERLLKTKYGPYQLWGLFYHGGRDDLQRPFTEIRALLFDKTAILLEETDLRERLLALPCLASGKSLNIALEIRAKAEVLSVPPPPTTRRRFLLLKTMVLLSLAVALLLWFCFPAASRTKTEDTTTDGQKISRQTIEHKTPPGVCKYSLTVAVEPHDADAEIYIYGKDENFQKINRVGNGDRLSLEQGKYSLEISEVHYDLRQICILGKDVPLAKSPYSFSLTKDGTVEIKLSPKLYEVAIAVESIESGIDQGLRSTAIIKAGEKTAIWGKENHPFKTSLKFRAKSKNEEKWKFEGWKLQPKILEKGKDLSCRNLGKISITDNCTITAIYSFQGFNTWKRRVDALKKETLDEKMLKQMIELKTKGDALKKIIGSSKIDSEFEKLLFREYSLKTLRPEVLSQLCQKDVRGNLKLTGDLDIGDYNALDDRLEREGKIFFKDMNDKNSRREYKFNSEEKWAGFKRKVILTLKLPMREYTELSKVKLKLSPKGTGLKIDKNFKITFIWKENPFEHKVSFKSSAKISFYK